jgi:hypothetical protein
MRSEVSYAIGSQYQTPVEVELYGKALDFSHRRGITGEKPPQHALSNAVGLIHALHDSKI